MDIFNIEKFVLGSIEQLTLEEATKFAEAHGYSIRIVKKYNEKEGKFHPLVCTLDYVTTRINIAVASGKIHHVEGLG